MKKLWNFIYISVTGFLLQVLMFDSSKIVPKSSHIKRFEAILIYYFGAIHQRRLLSRIVYSHVKAWAILAEVFGLDSAGVMMAFVKF